MLKNIWMRMDDDIPRFLVNEDTPFPDVEQALAEPNGLLAVSRTLSTPRLLAAYRQGIFPWYDADSPVLWWSPNPRAVLRPDDFVLARSLRKILRRGDMTVTDNQAFDEVIMACANIVRKGEPGTWITPEMQAAYQALHHQGHASSIEVWQDNTLVGGLYGVHCGTIFCGESMFSRVSNASKVALAHLVYHHRPSLIDCQLPNPHLTTLGATVMTRRDFVHVLKQQAGCDR